MTNPFPYSGMWVTPSSVEELFEMCNQYTGEQRALALHVAMMAMNLAHKTVDKETV